MTDAFDNIPMDNASNYIDDINGEMDPEEQERINKVKEREQQMMAQLQEKQVEFYSSKSKEFELKNQRREQAKADLAEMLATHAKERELRHQNEEALREAKDGSGEHKDNWAKVKGNIALKGGDYPGENDISRMRECIVNKASDEQRMAKATDHGLL